jgi:N-carbamoyl-L-amino-acid hydrolase
VELGGHDAQNMARISKTGMIFVPSVGGKSHSKDEYTKDEDLVNGLKVLLGTVIRLDRM